MGYRSYVCKTCWCWLAKDAKLSASYWTTFAMLGEVLGIIYDSLINLLYDIVCYITDNNYQQLNIDIQKSLKNNQ